MQCAPLASLPAAAELLYFEEIKFEPVMVDAIDADVTLDVADLGHGDIVVVQRAHACDGAVPHPLAPAFFSHLKNRLVVVFQRSAPSKLPSKPVVLELTALTTIGEARVKLATTLGLHATQLVQFSKPYGSPLALRQLGEDELVTSLLQRNDGTTANTLTFDVVSADTKAFSVSWMEAPSEPLVQIKLSIGLGQAVHDLLALLLTKLGDTSQLPQGFNQPLRLLQLDGHVVIREVGIDEALDDLDDGMWRFRAEPVPEEQLHVGQNERVVHVAHVRRGTDSSATVVPFGEPFLLKLREDEPLVSVKARIAVLLGLDAASATFSSVRWGTVNTSNDFDAILSDSYPVMSRFVHLRSGYADFGTFLALEHATATRTKRSRAQNDGQALRSVHSRQLRIYN